MEVSSTFSENSTSPEVNESTFEDVQLYQVHYGAVYVVICIIALSIVGNGLIITAFIRDQRLQVLFNMLVINLAVADIIMSLVIVVEIFNISAYLFIFKDAKMLCQMFAVTANAIPTEQLIIAHLMCNDRHRALQHRLAYNRRFNRWHTETLKIVLTWAFSFTASFFITDILSTLKKMDFLMCMFPDRPLFISKMAYMHGALLSMLFIALAFVIRDFRKQRRKRPYFIRLLNLEPDLEPGCDDLENRTSLQCLVPRSPCHVFRHEEFEMTPLPRAKPTPLPQGPASPLVDTFKTIVASRPQSVLPRPLCGGAANPTGCSSSPSSLRLFSFRSLSPGSRAKAYDSAFRDWIQMEDLQEHEQWENIERRYQRLPVDAVDDPGQVKVNGEGPQVELLAAGKLKGIDLGHEGAGIVGCHDTGKFGKDRGVPTQLICGGDKRNSRPVARKSAIFDRCRSENRKSVRIMMSDLSRVEGCQKNFENDFDGSSYSQDDGSQSSCSLSEDEPTDFPVPRFKPRTDSLYTLRSCMSISEESTNLATSELKDSSTHSDNSDVLENADLRSPCVSRAQNDTAGVTSVCLDAEQAIEAVTAKLVSDVPDSGGSAAIDAGRRLEFSEREPQADRSDASVYLDLSGVEIRSGNDQQAGQKGETTRKLKHAVGSFHGVSNEDLNPRQKDADDHGEHRGDSQDTCLSKDAEKAKETPLADSPVRLGGTNQNNNFDETLKGAAEQTPDLQGCANMREFPELEHSGETSLLLDSYAGPGGKLRHSKEVDNINNSAGRKNVQGNRPSQVSLKPRQKLAGGGMRGYRSEVTPEDVGHEPLSQSISELDIDHAAQDWISFYNVRCAPNTAGRSTAMASGQGGDCLVPMNIKEEMDYRIDKRQGGPGEPHVSGILKTQVIDDDVTEVKTSIDDWVSLGGLKSPYFSAGNPLNWRPEIFDACRQQDVERAIEGWIEFYDINGHHPCPSEASDGRMSPKLSVSDRDVGKHGWTDEYLKMVGEIWRGSFQDVGEDNRSRQTHCGSTVGYFVSVDVEVHAGNCDVSPGLFGDVSQSGVSTQETAQGNTTGDDETEESEVVDEPLMPGDGGNNQEEATAAKSYVKGEVAFSQEPIREPGIKSHDENEPIVTSDDKCDSKNPPVTGVDLKSNNEQLADRISGTTTVDIFKADVDLSVPRENNSVVGEIQLITELTSADETRQVSPDDRTQSPHTTTTHTHPDLSAEEVHEKRGVEVVSDDKLLNAPCAGLKVKSAQPTRPGHEMGDVTDEPTAPDGSIVVQYESDPHDKGFGGCRDVVREETETGTHDARLITALGPSHTPLMATPHPWLTPKQILEGLSLSRRAFLSEIGLYHDVLVGAVPLSGELLRVTDAEPCPYCVSKQRDMASRELAEISSAEASSMNNEPYQSCAERRHRRRGHPSIQFCVIDDMTTNNTSMLDQSEISYISNGPHRGLLSRDSRWPIEPPGSPPAFVMPIDDSYNSYRGKVHMMRQTCWSAVVPGCRSLSFEHLKAHDPELSILVSLLLLMLVQLICWTPLTALYIYYDIKGFPSKARDQEISYLLLWCTRMALQPFIYAYYSSCFRQNFANLLLCRFDR